MARIEKLIIRLLSFPKDFTWEELTKLLGHFGYSEVKTGKTGGSRRKFADNKGNVINLHKPHPGDTIKIYVIRQVIEQLTEKGYLHD